MIEASALTTRMFDLAIEQSPECSRFTLLVNAFEKGRAEQLLQSWQEAHPNAEAIFTIETSNIPQAAWSIQGQE